MYEHLVVFKLKENVTAQMEQELLDKLQSFKGRIPGIVQLSAGINVTEETENRHGFNLGLRVTFSDREALRQYSPHPLHQEFVRMLDGLLDSVVVVDYPFEL
ncbi:Dabb family protein [Paenibacillus hamazuiensis]|uniref:Dabb family protein n=1 Tax=Paenibacillus hamazuiensis TaxID=2936508 RepID=UPI00200FE7F9|nr:Dabb family protein [Paenibacillus hamazuiensis]